jgi:hypothetical protein
MRWSLKGRLGSQCSWMGALILAALACAAPAFAQFEHGQISGVVKDQSGGVMPGVTVTATNKQTGVPTSEVSDASGFYTFPNLQPGRYDVVAELQGFKKVVRNDLQLDAAGQIRYDITMATGTLTEEVTVTAESTPLQTDVAVRKTIESKDIEQLALAGRNAMGVVGLKAGITSGTFISQRGFSDLGNGDYNINGSRSDENNITVDGATSIRTRASGNTIGILDADSIQEVQVLTADYMPEFGRASGGQLRFVTKSGSNRFSGSASYFYRDESLQANTWTRNKSTAASDNSGPAPFNYKQYGYSGGGPLMKDHLFFFGAQEWVNFYQVQSQSIVVPSLAMRKGDFSELLDPHNTFTGKVTVLTNPLTGQPFPNNVIPASQLSPNGMAIMNAWPLPTPGYQNGTQNAIVSSPNPQDQRKDHIRFDYRLNPANQFTLRLSKFHYEATDAFRSNLPYARTDTNRPNTTFTSSWTSTLSNSLINEATFTYSHDYVYINVNTDGGLYQRSKYGIAYPYVFPNGKEIPDKIPTVNNAGFQQIDGGPYPSHSDGPIYSWQDALTYVKGRHTIKAGVSMEYSGENDFDQINVNATPGGTNNQNGSFTFADNTPGGTGLAAGNLAIGLFSNYAELGQRSFTQWRSLGTDTFVQDSWKPTSNLTVEGGVRWVFWPPWYSLGNNIASFEPNAYNKNNAAVMDPKTGLLVSGPRYNGVVLPGTGFLGDAANSPLASDPQIQALFTGAPRGLSAMHWFNLEPRLGASYALNDKTILRLSSGIFHNRTALNDSSLLGGNPPFQPQVTIANGSVDNPGGGASASRAPFAVTGQDVDFKYPVAWQWAANVQREIPWGFTVDVGYVGRRGQHLQRERNINQLPLGTLFLPQNQGVNIAALRPYQGYGVIRLAENAGHSMYNGLQISADRRYKNGLKVGVAYTLGKSSDNGSSRRDVVFNTYDDTQYYGPSSYDRRHVLNFYYIYDLPFWRAQDTLMHNILGGWQVSGATFYRTGTPFSIGTVATDFAGVGDASIGQPYNIVGDIHANANGKLSTGKDNNYLFNPSAFQAPAQGTWGNATRDIIYGPGANEWDLALFKNVRTGGTSLVQFRAEVFNLFNHPNLNTTNREAAMAVPTSATFGRITGKDDARRDIQLSLRVQF